jgi:hypothetical protein
LIDPSALRAADFDTFFSHRRASLVCLISEAMGKSVVDDLSEGAEFAEIAEYEVEADDLTDDDIGLTDHGV